MQQAPHGSQKFDRYAASYEGLVADSIQASGEAAQYFLQYKLACLQRLGLTADVPVLDFGCGTGNLTQCLAGYFRDVEGYDPSAASIEVARPRIPSARFHLELSSISDARFGVAVVSGVLHHVRPAERVELLRSVRQKLVPGGKLVVFEHNPWNPLTRRAVAACPFDDDAVLLWPGALKRLVKAAGFLDIRLDYIVFFPRALAALRALEPHLARVGLGAQTMTVGTQR